MADIDELLRRDGELWRSRLSDGNPVFPIVHPSKQSPRRRWAVEATIAGIAAIAVVIATVSHAGPGARGHDRTASGPTPAAVTDGPVTNVVVPVRARTTTLTLQLKMAAQVVSQGKQLSGTLVILNKTSSNVYLSSDCNFPAVYGQLVNTRVPARSFVSGGVLCGGSRTKIKPGSNVFPVTFLTTYFACGGDAPIDGERCNSGGSLPFLPTGTYRTSITVNGLPAGDHTPSVEVTIIPA